MNGNSNTPGDDRISAWIDGMLDREGAKAMQDIAAMDEGVTARAQRLRYIDSLVRGAVPQEDEVPAYLLERLGLGHGVQADNVVSFGAALDARGGMKRTAPAARFWRMAAQVMLVAGLGLSVAMWNMPGGTRGESADYRTLSDAARPVSADVNAMVVFAPGIDARRAHVITGALGARLVGEPNEAGAWKLAIAPLRRDAVLAGLRADPHVAMAEPVDGGQP